MLNLILVSELFLCTLFNIIAGDTVWALVYELGDDKIGR